LALTLAPLGKQDLVRTLAKALMEIGVDGGTVDGGDFVFDEKGRVTGLRWRRCRWCIRRVLRRRRCWQQCGA
jgi:hypothetical protein